MFFGLQGVNTVTLSDKKERTIIANIPFYRTTVGFWLGTCCVTEIAFNHARFPVNFQNSWLLE